MSIIDVVLVLAIVLAIGYAIYSHRSAIKADIDSAHQRLDGFIAGFHLGSSQPSETFAPLQSGPVGSPIKPGDAIPLGKPSVTDLLFHPDQRTSDILDGRVGQSGEQVNLDPHVIYYNHHTFVRSGETFTTGLLQGKARISFTYTSQEPGKQAPTSGTFWASDGSKVENQQLGVEAILPLIATSGTVTVGAKLDTDGRVIAQLLRG